ncbi:MAG: hypothetical protein KAH84_00795 [Thiomargarita sp.]|nr:hypothetical protein [Thiomargarita sp.]
MKKILNPKIIFAIYGLVFASVNLLNISHAAVTDQEWKIGMQCMEEADLPPKELFCMKLTKKQLSTIMRSAFMIGTKTRQPWCNLVDNLGLRASTDDARGREGMVSCDSDEYERAFQHSGQVVQCITRKMFTDYNQWGVLATHLYYCDKLDSSGDCAAAVEIAKKIRGKEPDCSGAMSLWQWVKRLNYVRLSLDSIYDDNCGVKAKNMLPYCESVIHDKPLCKSMYGK